ncbi:Lrp/AsnC family transcriptional regulator [Luteimonas sp. RIT-PG2_3]|jgi:DNA-binding Lrp family transcriptional regulator
MILTEKEAELLSILKKDSKKTVSALARELSLSRPTVQSMLDRLDAVAIEKYTVQLKPEFNNSFIRAFVFMIRDPKHWAKMKAAMLKIDEVRSFHTITGQYDVIIELQVDSGNFSRMDRILDEIVAMDGVHRTHTAMVLTSSSTGS